MSQVWCRLRGMTDNLSFTRAASEARAFHKERNPARSAALEDALEVIDRGKGRSGARRDDQHNVWLTDVWIEGRQEYDLIVWEERDDGTIAIIHIGKSSL